MRIAGKTLVVLGGGVGGLVAANELRRLLPEPHRIVLIDKDLRHAFAPSFLWVMVGRRHPERIVRDLRTLVHRGVEVMQAEVIGIDVKAGRIETTHGPIHYDSLVVALGAELAPEAVPGLAQAAYTFYTWDGAVKLYEALRAFPNTGGVVAILVCSTPYKCPGAPHEGAMLIADYFRRRGLTDRVELHLFTPESQPMPVAGPILGRAVEEMLQARGIAFHPLHKVTTVDGEARELKFEGKGSAPFDLLVAIPPHQSPRVVRESGWTNETGYVPVDPKSLRTSYDRVYAIGDITAIPLPGRWKPEVPLMLPKAGVFAHAQAKVVAQRIAAEVTGTSPADEFCGNGYCMLEAGEGMAGFAFGNFFAEPSPQVELRQLGRAWHWGKVLLERWWLAPPGVEREALRVILSLGVRWFGLPAVV